MHICISLDTHRPFQRLCFICKASFSFIYCCGSGNLKFNMNQLDSFINIADGLALSLFIRLEINVIPKFCHCEIEAYGHPQQGVKRMRSPPPPPPPPPLENL